MSKYAFFDVNKFLPPVGYNKCLTIEAMAITKAQLQLSKTIR